MSMNKKVRSKAAGRNDKISLTCTEFAANQERTEITVGNDKEFDNDVLLKLLGFEKNENGELSLPAVDHGIDRDSNGKIVRYEVAKRKVQESQEEKGA